MSVFTPQSPQSPLLFVTPLPAVIYVCHNCCKIVNFCMHLLRIIILQYNYITFSDAELISISIFFSLSSSPRQLYSSHQCEHIINLHHLRLMFILCERAARDKPIKRRIYYSLKATRKVITKFQHCGHCPPIRTQWKRTLMERAAKVIHFNTQVNPLFPSMGEWPSP